MQFRILVFLALGFTALQSASAAYVVVESVANGSRNYQDNYTGNSGSALLDISSAADSGLATFDASATARFSAGDLGVSATAQANGLTAGRQGSAASASAGFQDVVGFTGATSVRLNAEVLFEFITDFVSTNPVMGGSGSASGKGSFFASIWWWWGGGARETTFVVCNGGPTCERSYSPSSPGLHAFEQEIFVPAGQELWITTQMSATADTLLYNSLSGGLNGGTAYWSSSAYNSLRNGLTVLTPGVGFSSNSGHDYVFNPHAAVPEPGSLVLLALGLLAVVAHRRLGAA